MPDSARWARLNELFHAAVAMPAVERAAFLSAECGSDAGLRVEVDSLLAAHREGQTDVRPGAVAVGSRLSDYVVTGFIAAGGMGEVYRARDTKLGRDVAIKVLPNVFASDPNRLARFEREARLLATLNHPHIGAIYGLEDAAGVPALVLEMVEGPTLADRLSAGPLPVQEAVMIARQVAEALEAAHEQGIIHRDLKPANIKVRRDGTVKVLDFGLAKALAPASDAAPALTAIPTHTGVVMGTPPYMSPEQARGEDAGRQADIWSFGVVLYEMLTGASPFGRHTTADTLATVLGTQPDYSVLPSDTPTNVRHLVRRCLEKDRKRRWQHMGDVRIEVEDAVATLTSEAAAPDVASPVAANGRLRRAAGVLALVVLVGVAGWFLAPRSASNTPATVVHLSIPSLEPPKLIGYGSRHLAISEDGSRVAYTSANRLWIRRMGQQEAVAVEVSASNPFFSPSGEWVGFFGQTGGEVGLKKVPAVGGIPVPIASTSARPGGGTWRADGTIVFATGEGLYQVSENGGEPKLLVKPDSRGKEVRYAWPQFMPDGQSVLFTIITDDSIDGAQIAVLNVNTLEAKLVLTGGTGARYASTGHLVYAFGETLKAVAFDPETQQTAGDPVSLPGMAIATRPDSGAADFAVSQTGTLLFIAPHVVGQLRTFSWVDRQGKEEPLALAPGRLSDPRISPDGSRVAFTLSGANRDVWIWDLQRSSLTRLTSGPTEDLLPVWSRDNRRVFFTSDRTGNMDVYSQAADGATTDRVEFAGPGAQFLQSFTPDGARLIVGENFKDLSMLNLARPDRLEPLLHGEFVARLGSVSPDGNWLAYESNESGDRFEIFVRPFPDVSSRREKVSIEGGRFPVWGPKGSNELFFVDLDGGMMAASVTLSPSFSLGRVTRLFEWEKPPLGPSGTPYDVSAIDGRFLLENPATEGPAAINISVVLNWDQELKRLEPTR